jgi:hypothetical protein
MRTISKKEYLKAAQLFNWAKREHYVIWFTGEDKRHKRTEVMLPRLVKKGKLQSIKYGNRLIYCAKGKNRKPKDKYSESIEHGLACTEGLVRFWRSNMNGQIVPERYFRGLSCIPEWGIRYPNKKMLLYEFCTYDNFYQRLRYKTSRYESYVYLIEEAFGCDAVVLFVCDVDRQFVMNFIEKYKPAFWFTDYETFKKVPIGEQLLSPIYIWGVRGNEDSLKND